VTLVVDASMTIAWLFDDERIEAAHAVMRRVVAEGTIVPSLWRLEVANCSATPCDEGAAMRPLSIGHWQGSLASQSSATRRPTIAPGDRHGP
jgi:hypothetical protein